jgi:antitoxin MazE
MQIAKWGNSLAVRLPKKVVEELGLKEGDSVEIRAAGKAALDVAREEEIARSKRLEALKRLRKFRGWMPKDFKFDREEAHERGWVLDDAQVRPRKRTA